MKRDRPAYCYIKSGLLYYCRRGAKPIRIHSALGTPEFAAEYAKLLKGTAPEPSRTVKKLVASYYTSGRWAKHAKNTRRSYKRHFDYFIETLGNIDPAKLRRVHVVRMRDALSDKPTDANRKVGALSSLMEHGIDIGWIPKDQNPVHGTQALPPSKPPREPWPADKIRAYRETADGLALLIFEMCLGTGQRIGDVLRMTWADLSADGIKVKQGKTGARLTIPLTARLEAALAATARAGLTIVAQPNGKPVSYSYAAKLVQDVRKQIGAEAWDIHSLRHAAAAEIAALPGMTMEHVKAITGHASDNVARIYVGTAAQKARAKEAQEGRK